MMKLPSGEAERGELPPDQMRCPRCGDIAESDSVDIGVGLMIRGNFDCNSCGWEIDGPEDYGFISEDELNPGEGLT